MTSLLPEALFRNLEVLRRIGFYKKHPWKWTTRCRSDSAIFRGNIKSNKPSTSTGFFRAPAPMKIIRGRYSTCWFYVERVSCFVLRLCNSARVVPRDRMWYGRWWFHLYELSAKVKIPQVNFIMAEALKKSDEVLGIWDFILLRKMRLSERQRVVHFSGCFL